MPRRTAAILVVMALLAVAPRAAQLMLDPRAIDEAIAIGQSRLAAERTAYHSPYRLLVNKAPIDYIEVITPFRRVVLGAQGRAEIGDRGFGQRQAFELLALAPGAIDLQIELTFHPLNTYIGVPDYAVVMAPVTAPANAPAVLPRTLERIPRFGARVEGMPLPVPTPAGPAIAGGTQPMLGGTLIARFDGRLIGADNDGAAVSDVVLSENGRELVRVRVDLAKLR